jgi:outer membrane protein OmpA-like peptidoglycan-associated protein
MGITSDRDTLIPAEETTTITVKGPDDAHKEWQIGIWDEFGTPVKVMKGKGEMERKMLWDGKDKQGNPVQTNRYFRIMARGIDSKGERWDSNTLKLKSIPKLRKLKKGRKLTLTSITFAPYSYELDNQSKIELDRMVEVLLEQPRVKLLVKGHVSPFNWSKEKLLELSQQRAESVCRYMIEKGVKKNRLSAKGIGDTEPVGDNDSEENRALNRRTEFEVISAED